jgi:hypothetical protein
VCPRIARGGQANETHTAVWQPILVLQAAVYEGSGGLGFGKKKVMLPVLRAGSPGSVQKAPGGKQVLETGVQKKR